jgi:hypothetical protein
MPALSFLPACPFPLARSIAGLPACLPARSQSGSVTKEEFCEYLRNSVGMDAGAATTSGAELFSHLDVNADRALSAVEFVFGIRLMPSSLRRALLDTVPEALPADVERAAKEAVPLLAAEAGSALETLFAQLDSDGDGFLGIKELKVSELPEASTQCKQRAGEHPCLHAAHGLLALVPHCRCHPYFVCSQRDVMAMAGAIGFDGRRNIAMCFFFFSMT